MTTPNEIKPSTPTVEETFGGRCAVDAGFSVGCSVTVKAGASRWMKERRFWWNGWPESIDGMTMQIVADFTHLGGDSSHWWCES